ncbi:MAG TPA: LLM class F420-dependent oxidoreductase [Chloroflexota bacterium]|nr:LLM class F420-dependent oxidoreductase [Chloroflexota bacterium]
MHLGVNFPADHSMDDPSAIRDYAQAVEGLGFGYLTVVDHVLGADISGRPDWNAPYAYTHKSIVREAIVLLGFMAACTRTIVLGTAVIILPQRPTALVAKQLAELDVLSGGRALLGVGVGWNDVEFQALNEDFHNRGRRIEEQINVLRELWTNEVVDFEGQWHRIDRAGINPLPIQRPIPIWMGSGDGETPMRRVAQLADGWLPPALSAQAAEPVLERFRTYIDEAGRAASDIALAPRIRLNTGTPDDWAASYAAWEKLGATHFAINTNRPDATHVDEHIEQMRRFLEVIR